MNKLFSLLLLLSCILSEAQEIELFGKESTKGKIEIWAINKSSFTYTAKIDIEKEGMTQDVKTPIVKVLIGKAELLIATLTPIPRTSYGYSLKSTSIKGNALAQHDDQYVYSLPYPKGDSYKIDQGFNGSVTHMNRNSLDFGMGEGSEITAIRSGVVIEVVEDNKKGCPREECADYSNFILIEHSDGSMANYAHLQKNGALVEIGDKVKTGDLVGLSGSTGWATGPHLHLEVYTINWEGQTTIPVNFRYAEGVGVLTEGNSYTH